MILFIESASAPVADWPRLHMGNAWWPGRVKFIKG